MLDILNPQEATTLSSALARLLEALGRTRPVLLCIAGADALRGARWLPSRLPDNVKMIVTVTEGKTRKATFALTFKFFFALLFLPTHLLMTTVCRLFYGND